MGWSMTTYTVVVLGSAAVAMVVGLVALRKRPDPMAKTLAVAMFAVAAWAIPHAISFGYTGVESVAFWHRVRYIGTVVAPICYLVLALKYAGYDRWLSRRVYAALGLIPALTVLFVWTNPSGLFWESVTLVQVGDASVLVPEYGAWYWVTLGYLYLVTITSLLVLGSAATRSGPVYWKQAVLMFVGGLVPFATNAAIKLGIGREPMVDLTTTALAASGLIFAVALFYTDLLDISPVARDRLFEEIDDGVVVVGPDGQIRDFNSTATRVLGDIAINQPAEEIFASDVALDGGDLTVETDEGKRQFRTRSSALTDGRGRDVGRIVYLNDVSELVAREQRISVLNRILRHNIRNQLSRVSGHLELLEERVTAADLEHVEKARQATRRVTEFAEKAHNIERTLQGSDTSVAVSATATARRVVTRARQTYPDAVIDGELEAESGGAVFVRVVDEKLFELAISELVDNAVVHNDQEPPRVTVRVTADGGQVRVVVADNGPGIPEQETGVLDARVETELQHGSGLGLWLVKWTASLSSGEVTFSENDPRGSVVTLGLPAADE